jgi:hypothetical protein
MGLLYHPLMKVSIENSWTNKLQRKTEMLEEKNLFHHYFVHHKSHVYYMSLHLGLYSETLATKHSSHGTAGKVQ